MSEHMGIDNGKLAFWHLPYEEKGSFSYCHRCKKALKKLSIELHQGFMNEHIQVRCPLCKKTIWVAELTNSFDFKKEDKGFDDWGGRVLINNNQKCSVCKKPTNRFDCNCIQWYKGKTSIYCSSKCYKKANKE